LEVVDPQRFPDRFFCSGHVHLRGFGASRYRTPMLRRLLEATSSRHVILAGRHPLATLWVDFFTPPRPWRRSYPPRWRRIIFGSWHSDSLGFMVETPVSTIRATPVASSTASSRVSVGVGVVSSAGTGSKPRMRGRFDHGPRGIARRQFNLGFSFGWD
jgi:hypothetical protein